MTDSTRRSSTISLLAGGKVFRLWTSISLKRDLKEISGSFELEYLDEARADAAGVSVLSPPPYFPMLKPQMACTIKLDDEVVLVGTIEDIDLDEDGHKLRARVTGRDRAGDLHDCAAAPYGPAEFKGVDLLQIATIICQPFGITVRSETDIGEPFDRLAVGPHETALALLEKAARQRSVLLVSDGVGGLLLTRGGAKRGPAPIERGVNVVATNSRSSTRARFSDVFVKGQSERGAGHRKRAGSKAALDHSVVPFQPGAAGASASGSNLTVTAPVAAAARTNAKAGVLMTGHAVDPEITRWRPHVRMTKTQSGMSTTQEQAEWAVRVAKGEGEDLHYTVRYWRAGDDNRLWRPNELVAVYDPYTGIDTDMLIAGLDIHLDAQGPKTRLRVVGKDAYDRINEADRKRKGAAHGRHGRKRKGAAGPLDAGVSTFGGEP